MKTRTYSILAAILVAAVGWSRASTTYNGNGVTNNTTQGAFNGAIGSGSLTLSDDGTTISGTFTRGTQSSTTPLFNNSLTIYVDSVAGGFADTSGFADLADGNRRSIAGYNGGTSRSTLFFTNGFSPDYALSLEPYNGGGGGDFGGLWKLANGGNNSLPFVANVGLSPLTTSNAAVYTFSFTLASIGLTPGAGQSFELFGTFVSATGNRSSEAIAGNDIPGPGNAGALKGFIPFTQTDFGTYTTLLVPEPAVLALSGLSVLLTFMARRRRVS